MNLLAIAKAELLYSNTDAAHPFRHFYLSTHSEYPETRTVVKRDMDDHFVLTVFTDSRTPKVSQIRANNKVSALFYHPERRLQIRLNGTARLIGKEDLTYPHYFQQVNHGSESMNYSTSAVPGTPKKDEADIIYGDAIHLTVIRIHPSEIDVVQLGKEKHYRSSYHRDGPIWVETPLIP